MMPLYVLYLRSLWKTTSILNVLLEIVLVYGVHNQCLHIVFISHHGPVHSAQHSTLWSSINVVSVVCVVVSGLLLLSCSHENMFLAMERLLWFSVKCIFVMQNRIVCSPSLLHLHLSCKWIHLSDGGFLFIFNIFISDHKALQFYSYFFKIELITYVAQIVLEFLLLLSYSLHCWDYSHVSPGLFLLILEYLPKWVFLDASLNFAIVLLVFRKWLQWQYISVTFLYPMEYERDCIVYKMYMTIPPPLPPPHTKTRTFIF
jgi:hypothetical protein